MPIPDFIIETRRKLGHDLMWLPGVSAAVYRDDGAILLGQRSDNGNWAVLSGILEPGEDPAPGVEREILEETGVVARVRALVSIRATPLLTHSSGDLAQYLNLHFIADYVSGEAHVADDESLDVGWFRPDALPEPMARSSRLRIQDDASYLADPGAGPIFAR